MSKAGKQILDGLKDAVEGNFARVTIEGQTWYRRDADGGALLTGNADDHCPGCGVRLGDLPDDPVTIPRSQYEALIGAAKVFAGYMRFGSWGDDARCALASLRSAGIEIEGEKP